MNAPTAAFVVHRARDDGSKCFAWFRDNMKKGGMTCQPLPEQRAALF
jgi:hypothetical protein